MPTFSKILTRCAEISEELPGAVFIGGVAVYLHSLSKSLPFRGEGSHDADFMISFLDYGVLKDEEEVTHNPRLRKHQIVYEGVGFDVYVEKLSRLVVPYDEALAHAEWLDGVRVAALPHLLVLKLEALADRGHSSKGEKDRRDVVKICALMGTSFDHDLVEPYLRPRTEEVLREIEKGRTFHDLAGGNAHAAKKMRTAFTRTMKAVLR